MVLPWKIMKVAYGTNDVLPKAPANQNTQVDCDYSWLLEKSK